MVGWQAAETRGFLRFYLTIRKKNINFVGVRNEVV